MGDEAGSQYGQISSRARRFLAMTRPNNYGRRVGNLLPAAPVFTKARLSWYNYFCNDSRVGNRPKIGDYASEPKDSDNGSLEFVV